MQSVDYIPLAIHDGNAEVYIDLSKYLRKRSGYHAVSSADCFAIKEKHEDFRENNRPATSFVRYVIPMGLGVIIGFEPWASKTGRKCKLVFNTTSGFVGTLYFTMRREV